MKGVILHHKKNPRTVIMITIKMYASMARMSGNGEISNRALCDSLQLTNWILDSESTCHMKPHVSDFIPG